MGGMFSKPKVPKPPPPEPPVAMPEEGVATPRKLPQAVGSRRGRTILAGLLGSKNAEKRRLLG
jgi:hypothetical protein